MRFGSKGAVPEQIPVNFIIILAMFAVGAAVMLLMIGRWLDITGVKYKAETQRNAMNLLQLIVSNSPLVKRDPVYEPVKLVLDSQKLTEYQNRAGIGMENVVPNSERDKWEKCCDFLDFDYNFTVHDIVTAKNWTISNLIFDYSDCYPQRFIGFADLPIVIDENGYENPGVAVIEMSKTPLSELSFWLSQAFVRASWDKYREVYSAESEYAVKVSLDSKTIKCVKISDVCSNNYRRVCIILKDDRKTCKNFVCDSSVTFDQGTSKTTRITGTCFDASISTSMNKVTIFYPGDCS